MASGAVVTLTAPVRSGNTAVTPGLVNFCDATATYCTDIHLLGSAQLLSGGTAVFKFRPGPGSHSYKAVFAGTTSYTASTSASKALTVNSSVSINPSATVVTQSGTQASYTLTADVTGVGAAGPTGSVTFTDTSDGGKVLGTVSLGSAPPNTTWYDFQDLTVAGKLARSVASGGFNGDGIPDLVFTLSGYVGVFLGNGDGTFGPAILTPGVWGLLRQGIAVADFNQDGKPDLAITSTSGVSILLGKGDGTFAPGVLIGSGDTWDVVAGDFNGDGIPDLAAVEPMGGNGGVCDPYLAAGSVIIMLGKGDGTFTTLPGMSAGHCPDTIAIGDFNGDGIQDLAVPSQAVENPGSVTILLSNGDGTFTASPNGPETIVSPEGILAADFNGDGYLDLAVTTPGPPETLGAPADGILLGNGAGGFAPLGSRQGGGEWIWAADLNNDGNVDLVIGPGVYQPGNGLVYLLAGNGDGTFGPATEISTVSASGFVAADLNGDGFQDFATSTTSGSAPGLGSVFLRASTQTAVLSGVVLAASSGEHTIQASYGGDSTHRSSSATISLVAPSPGASLSATSLVFKQDLGVKSPSQPVTLSDTGYAPLTINSIQLTGASAASFAASNNCGASLAAGASCVIQVTFDPMAAGKASASIIVSVGGAGSPFTISLAGSSTSPASLSATSMPYGDQPIGMASPSQQVILTNNTTDETLTISSIKLTGPNASAFTFLNSCGSTLTTGTLRYSWPLHAAKGRFLHRGRDHHRQLPGLATEHRTQWNRWRRSHGYAICDKHFLRQPGARYGERVKAGDPDSSSTPQFRK